MDIDIDTQPGFNPLKIFPKWAKASMVQNDQLKPHPVGVYPQDIPIDPVTNLSAIPYDVAEAFGYTKIDFLHLNLYQHFKTRNEINELLKKEPDWNLLQIPSVVQKLFQLSKHGDIIKEVKPQSILELADVMALIRPAKRQLLLFYKKDRKNARVLLWTKDNDGQYAFKKSHAISYAYVVWLQLHLIEDGRI